MVTHHSCRGYRSIGQRKTPLGCSTPKVRVEEWKRESRGFIFCLLSQVVSSVFSGFRAFGSCSSSM